MRPSETPAIPTRGDRARSPSGPSEILRRAASAGARRIAAALAAVCVAAPLALGAPGAEEGPRTAILCAYEPEWQALLPAIADRHEERHAGVVFVTGRIAQTPVVLIESGISTVNATLAAQAAIDRYGIDRLIVMGISGGADPELHIGDVVIPEQWSQYLQSVFAREQDGRYVLPGFATQQTEHFGMIFPQPAEIPRPQGEPEMRTWFPVDPGLLDAARAIPAGTALATCTAARACLQSAPRVVVGGGGVSGPAFIDNAAFRDFAARTFGARALDMESAAVAQVAYMNRVPFLAIRSLSDLAGAEPDANQMKAFETLASQNAVTVLERLLTASSAPRPARP